MKILIPLCLLFIAFAASASPTPYDEKADAKADVQHALAQAAIDHTPVIVIFGANWCPDCQVLSKEITSGSSATLLGKDFKIVKISVGRFDKDARKYNKNADIAESYGVPLKKGIPAVLILSPDNKVLYVTREGEVADARHMGESGIYDFFKKATASATEKK